MGLYDREYAHTRGGGLGGGGFGGRPGTGGWSANTWIIVVCVAVFALDALLGINLKVSMGTEPLPGVPRSALRGQVVVEQAVRSRTLPGAMAFPIVRGGTGEQLGEKRFEVMPLFQAIGHFSTGKGFKDLEVWRLVGFQFLHANMSHLFMNMLGLFFFGPLVESRLGKKKYVAFYLMCGICGALMYLVLNGLGQLNLHMPGILVGDPYTPLIGASAGVFGVLMASAYLAPNSTVLLFFLFPAPLRVVVYGFVALAAFNLLKSGQNAGGDAAHIGGAIAGAFFVRKPELLHDFLDFSGKDARARRPKRVRKPAPRRGGPSEAEVDRILAKVATEGLASLTEKERKTLAKASASKRG